MLFSPYFKRLQCIIFLTTLKNNKRNNWAIVIKNDKTKETIKETIRLRKKMAVDIF